MSQIFSSRNKEGDDGWISVSDLMAGLMMVFLFISIIYAKTADERSQNVSEVVAQWLEGEWEIYKSLELEFRNDFEKWNAILDRQSLTIRFLSPDVLFESGKANLRPEFKEILDDFIPRYIELLFFKFDESISGVRIEGHTSSDWRGAESSEEAFIENMKLSQARTRTVLEYSLAHDRASHLTPWMIKTVSANGLSSAQLVTFKDGTENEKLSRRVEFRVLTKTRNTLIDVLDRAGLSYERKI